MPNRPVPLVLCGPSGMKWAWYGDLTEFAIDTSHKLFCNLSLRPHLRPKTKIFVKSNVKPYVKIIWYFTPRIWEIKPDEAVDGRIWHLPRFLCQPHYQVDTGCSLDIVFFLKILKYSGLWPSAVSLCVSVCTHTRRLEHQRCSRTGRVQKNHKIYGKNTIFNELLQFLFLIQQIHST